MTETETTESRLEFSQAGILCLYITLHLIIGYYSSLALFHSVPFLPPIIPDWLRWLPLPEPGSAECCYLSKAVAKVPAHIGGHLTSENKLELNYKNLTQHIDYFENCCIFSKMKNEMHFAVKFIVFKELYISLIQLWSWLCSFANQYHISQ